MVERKETLYSGWGQTFWNLSLLAMVKTAYQRIEIYKSDSHGNILFLDGAVQITELDEFVYQEMMTHVPMICHGQAKDILIVGAGDGGILRHVLQHKGVESATMVEIDAEVIRLSKRFLPQIGGNAWADPRAHVVVADAIQYVATATAASFDVILIDSTDPDGVGEVLFTEEFYHQCARVLRPDGILVNQGGVPFMQPSELREVTLRQRKVFDHVSGYVVAVPTYVGGVMLLGIASKKPLNKTMTNAEVLIRASASGITGVSRYWNPEIHTASFALPTYIGLLM